MTCGMCRRSQLDGFRSPCDGIESVDQCSTGDVPKLMPGNIQFCDVLLTNLPVLRDGFGGIAGANLGALMDAYGVPAGQRPVIMGKAAAVMRGIDQMRETEKARHG